MRPFRGGAFPAVVAVLFLFGCGRATEVPPAQVTAPAEAPAENWQRVNGLATSVDGEAEILLAGETEWRKLAPKDPVPVGARIRTGKGGVADVLVVAKGDQNGAVRLKENTEIMIEENRTTSTDPAALQEVAVKMDRGRLLHRFATREAHVQYSINTDIAAAAIRGTEFDVVLDPGFADFRVLAGKVIVKNLAGEKELSEKTGSSVPADAAPADPRVLSQNELKELGECSLVKFAVAIQKTQRVATLAEVRNLAQALDMYRIQNEKYPETLREAGLDKLDDAWGSPYRYEQKNGGQSYVIRSNGKDGAAGTEDDLVYEPTNN